MVLENYVTIHHNGESEIVVKKSRFICSLSRVTDEIEAKQFLQTIKKEHWKANHHCSAFLLGEKGEIQRSSDDGEPSGTAGIPMLEVLKKKELYNVAAVVTRYFGGIKLGAGGLIRAYSHAVSHALTDIGLVRGVLQQEMFISVDYSALSRLENFLAPKKYYLKEITYQEKVTLLCLIDFDKVDEFTAEMINFSNGKADIKQGKQSYQEHPCV